MTSQIRLIRYDFGRGLRDRWKYLIIPLFIFAILTVRFIGYLESDFFSLNFGGVMFLHLCGLLPVSSSPDFFLPIQWLLIQVGCMIFTLEYPMRDLKLSGRQMMLRCGKRTHWWHSKCIWCLVSVAIYWAVGYLVILAFCLANNLPLTTYIDIELVYSALDECDISASITGGQAILLEFVLPVAVSMAVCMLQMVISVLAGSNFFAMFICAALAVWSACDMNYVAFLNFAMYQRLSVLSSVGLNVYAGLAILAAVVIASWVIGAFGFAKADILDEKKI